MNSSEISIRERVGELRKSAGNQRAQAGFFIGLAVMNTAITGYMAAAENLGFAIYGGIAATMGGCVAAVDIHEAGEKSHEAATLEGALAQQQLQAPVLFDQEA